MKALIKRRHRLYNMKAMNLWLWGHLQPFYNIKVNAMSASSLQECGGDKMKKSPRTVLDLDCAWCKPHPPCSDICGHLPMLINMHGFSPRLSDLPQQQWWDSLIYSTPLHLLLFACEKKLLKLAIKAKQQQNCKDTFQKPFPGFAHISFICHITFSARDLFHTSHVSLLAYYGRYCYNDLDAYIKVIITVIYYNTLFI